MKIRSFILLFICCIFFTGCPEEEIAKPKKSTMYDKAGNIIEIINYDLNGNKTKSVSSSGAIYISEYDEHNNLLKFYKDNKLILNYKYDYDAKGKKIKKWSLDSETNKPSSLITYEYNEEGKIIKENSCNPETLKSYSYLLYNYDNKGNEIKTTGYSISLFDDEEDKLIYTCEYKRDEKGNITEIIIDGNTQTKIKYEYEGNLIKTKTINNLKENQTRIIKYEY